MADAPKLLGTDTLRTAYPKVNMAIDNANEALRNSEDALDKATQALANSENTQAQLDQIVIEGDSSVEAAQARVDADGLIFTTLKERLDTKETQFAERLAYIDDELVKKAFQSDLESLQTQVQNMGDGSPKGAFATFADLQAAYPNGTTGIFVVLNDGKWYYWNGISWMAGGVYQGTLVSTTNMGDGVVTRPKLHPYLSGFNNNRIELTYENGLLTRVTEKDGDITVSRQILSYDENNRLVQVEEQANGKRIITTLIYYNDGRLSYTQNTIEE